MWGKKGECFGAFEQAVENGKLPPMPHIQVGRRGEKGRSSGPAEMLLTILATDTVAQMTAPTVGGLVTEQAACKGAGLFR